jgi:hypothetical protein
MSGLMTSGYDPLPFLHTRGVDSHMLLDPDATVPMSACVGLLADGVRATGDDNLGLHVAEHADARLMPGPFSEFNMLAGLTVLKLRDFTVGTIIGCAPKALAWSGIGALLF